MDATIAAGHVYHPTLGSGVEWLPGQARLWQGGGVIAEAKHDTSTAYEFFHGLKFAEAFPTVQYWWFRSQWSGLVSVSQPEGRLDGPDTIYGYMQFGEGDSTAQMWTVSASDAPVSVAVPFPPGETQPLNLPLRWELARLTLDVLLGSQDFDDLLPVSSLVRRDDRVEPLPYDDYLKFLYAPTLEQAFPRTIGALTAEVPYFLGDVFRPDNYWQIHRYTRSATWMLEDARLAPLRDLLCELQGLEAPVAPEQE